MGYIVIGLFDKGLPVTSSISCSAIWIFVAVISSAIISGCRPKQADNGGQPPPIIDPGGDSDYKHPVPDPDLISPSPHDDSVPPAPDPDQPTTPDVSKPPPVPDSDFSEPNWDSATRTEISTGEFVYDPEKKIWSCYSNDTCSVVWKISGTGKYPVPKGLDAEAICDCCGYHGVKVVLMTPKEWGDSSAEQEKGRTVKRAVIAPISETKFDGTGCGGTCSCKEEQKK